MPIQVPRAWAIYLWNILILWIKHGISPTSPRTFRPALFLKSGNPNQLLPGTCLENWLPIPKLMDMYLLKLSSHFFITFPVIGKYSLLIGLTIITLDKQTGVPDANIRPKGMGIIYMYQYRIDCKNCDFWIQLKGKNAGKPLKTEIFNSIGVKVTDKRLDPLYFFFAVESLFSQNKFTPLLKGSTVPYLRLRDISKVINNFFNS